jgi:hypothetical protein
MTEPRNRTPAIIGFLFAGALILAAGFLASRGTRSEPGAVPPLRIVAPAADTVANPVVLEFSTPAPLTLTAAGWTARDMHLHLMLDGVEIMPAAADITATDSTFLWRLPPLEPGRHTLFLTWAGRHHGNLPGLSDTLSVHVHE